MAKGLTLLILFLLLPFSLSHAEQKTEKVLLEKDSLYQHLVVLEDTAKKQRFYYSNKRDGIQGSISLDAPEKPLFEYVRMSFISLAFLDREPKDVLVVGLGSGAMPRYFNRYYPEASTDIAELDPDVLEIAKKYFSFQENRTMKVHLNDGRVYLKRTPRKYDIIFLDAYQGSDIPFHLTTVEFLREVQTRLKEGGVVVANILSPFRNKFFDSMVMTYKKVFPRLYVFAGKKSRNYIFIATTAKMKMTEEEITAKARKIQTSKKFDIDLMETASSFEHSADYEWSSAKVLTDDFAPVNLYKYQKSGAKGG